MRLVISAFFLAFCLLVSGFAFAGSCPSGAGDCFLCGGVDGIPCTTNCTGKYTAGVGNVACECPQGQSCKCYCPYAAGALAALSDECLADPECAAKHMPVSRGMVGYVAKFDGNVMLEKAGTMTAQPAESLMVINEDDKLIIPDGGRVMVVFPGNNVRIFFGEGEVSVRKEKEALEIADDGRMSFVATSWRLGKSIIRQIRMNPHGEPANTVTGTGNMLPEGEQVYSPFAAEYEIESEVIFEGNGDAETVKVIDGKATVRTGNGRSAVVRTGEQITFSANSLDASGKKPFGLSRDDIWWGGLVGGTCGNECDSALIQTPYPGCSCVEAASGKGCGGPAFILALIFSAVMIIKRR